MLNNFPAGFQDLLTDDARAFAYLATVMPDNTPQVTPVWFDTDGKYLRVNSARGRVKDRNMRKRPQVTLVIADPKNPYRYVQVRGTVIEFTQEGAAEHIDALAKKYTGADRYPNARDDRVINKIKIEKTQSMG